MTCGFASVITGHAGANQTANWRSMMKQDARSSGSRGNRRSFLRNGMVAAGAMTAGVGLVSSPAAFADAEDHAPVTKGDIAILTFLSALEQVEADLWIQYSELAEPTSKRPRSTDLLP